MYKTLLLLSGLFLFKFCISQTFTVADVSEKINWRIGVSNFTTLPNGEILSLAYEGKWNVRPFGVGGKLYSGDFVIRKYGADLVEKQASTLKLENVNSEAGLLKIVALNDQVFLFYAKQSLESKSTDINLISIDSKTLASSGETTIISLPLQMSYYNPLSLRLSKNKKFALLYVPGKEEKHLISFGEEGRKQRSIRLPIEEKNIWLRDQIIDNNGQVYVLYEDVADKRVSAMYIDLYAGALNAKARKLTIDFTDKHAQFKNFQTNDITGQIYLAGTFQNKPGGNAAGVFIAEIPAIAAKVKTIFKEFDAAILAGMNEDGYARKEGKDPGLTRGSAPIKFLTREDGSVDLLTEYNMRDGEKVFIYRSGSIVDAHFKDGQFSFVRIPKSQSYANTNGFLSCYPFVYGNKLVLIYNDREDNLSRPLDKSPALMGTPKNSVLVAAIIDENNGVERRMIWDNGEGSYAAEPLRFLSLDKNKILITQAKVGIAKFSYRLGMLQVD